MSRRTRRILHVTLACIPFVMMIIVTPFVAYRSEPFILGLPLMLFWIVLSVVMTAVCMAAVYYTDPSNRSDTEPKAQVRS